MIQALFIQGFFMYAVSLDNKHTKKS